MKKQNGKNKIEGLLEDVAVEKSGEVKCKGIYFRAEVSNFMSGDGTDINTKLKLRFLRRPSCAGCEKCGWFWDFIKDDLWTVSPGAYLPDLENGKTYTPIPVLESADWEMPHIKEISHIKFHEVSL